MAVARTRGHRADEPGLDPVGADLLAWWISQMNRVEDLADVLDDMSADVRRSGSRLPGIFCRDEDDLTWQLGRIRDALLDTACIFHETLPRPIAETPVPAPVARAISRAPRSSKTRRRAKKTSTPAEATPLKLAK